jgi:hypothetical protein
MLLKAQIASRESAFGSAQLTVNLNGNVSNDWPCKLDNSVIVAQDYDVRRWNNLDNVGHKKA